jgi:hypothetical protein
VGESPLFIEKVYRKTVSEDGEIRHS